MSARSTNPRVIISACVCTLASAIPSPVLAGAWLQKPGHGQLIVTTSYYQASTYYDDSGKSKSQHTYRKAEINPYGEYGLSDHWAIGASLLIDGVAQEDSATGQRLTNAGWGDSEWFARYRAWQGDNTVISLRPFVKLPGLDAAADQPTIASDDPDAGLAVAGGYSFTLYGMPAFIDAEFAYRYRFGDPHDQITFNPTFGIRPDDKWLLMPQIFSTWRMASDPVGGFVTSPSNDYDLIKAQMSAVYQVDNSYSLQGGFFYNIDGRNTSGGGGMMLAIWRQF